LAEDAPVSRRSALRLLSGAAVAVAGSAVLAACGAAGGGTAQTGSSTGGGTTSSASSGGTSSAASGGSKTPAKLTGSGLQFVKVGSNGQYTLTTRGDDIWNTADTFTYLCTQTTGDGTWTVKVDSLDQTDPWAKCGLMARASLDPGSRYVNCVVTPGNGVKVQWRDTDGDSAAGNDNVDSSQTAPCWLKLNKKGTTWTGYMSTDGKTYSESVVATYNVDMGSGKYYIGICACAHNASMHGNAVVEAITGFTPTECDAVGTNDTA
jgi:hypothetical protein